MFSNIFYLLVSFIITFFSVPTIKRFASKNNIFDKPDLRKQKGKLMVRLGGGSFVLGYFVSNILLLINYQSRQDIELDINLIQILLFGSFCFFIIGLLLLILSYWIWSELKDKLKNKISLFLLSILTLVLGIYLININWNKMLVLGDDDYLYSLIYTFYYSFFTIVFLQL